MAEVTLLFPHHLPKDHPALHKERIACFVEDPLFFSDKQYPTLYHKQKLIFHRASMKAFEEDLKDRGFSTKYIDAEKVKNYKKGYADLLAHTKASTVHCLEFDDYTLEKRIKGLCEDLGITLKIYSSNLFLNSHELFCDHFSGKKNYFFHSFYILQRKRLGVLLTKGGSPQGGKWSFDSENRKKAPPQTVFPDPIRWKSCTHVEEASRYVERHFPSHVGSLAPFAYPTTHQGAKRALRDFLEKKLALFGDFEDAIDPVERHLFHSQLSPLLNVGLITPKEVIEQTLSFAENHDIPLNSLEGFIRQVIGWREFIRSVYLCEGTKQRKGNFFHHRRKMPSCFYSATSGIEPIDNSIACLKEGAYLHHIERLMVLGNFFLLCEIDPDEIYRWFMEFFIDAYDWVMVPNVYGMSQYADGGLMTTKPYISGSNYILKMSHYKKGPWTEVWDSLFWRFMGKHLDFFQSQPRLHMLTAMAKKKYQDGELMKKADRFLHSL